MNRYKIFEISAYWSSIFKIVSCIFYELYTFFIDPVNVCNVKY